MGFWRKLKPEVIDVMQTHQPLIILGTIFLLVFACTTALNALGWGPKPQPPRPPQGTLTDADRRFITDAIASAAKSRCP